MSDEQAEAKTIFESSIAEADGGGATLAGGPTSIGGPPDGGAPGVPSAAVEMTLAFSSLTAPNAPASADRPAPVVAGYEILGELGRGAVGVVYHARQVRLNRPCALKMILAGEHTGPEAALRFLAEAEAVARLQHPNVIQIHNLGESAGLPFVELEFAPGGSLDKQLDGTPWAPRAAARTVEALARGVAEAHRLGIVHRDLKPANILLAADGTPKVADFGLAKSVGVDSGLTRTESVMGTPSYMAPEQAEGKAREVGPTADVYALGAILYELVTGRPPFRGTTVLETLALVKTTEPVPPTRLAPGLPRDLETIALKCLEKAPARRYESAAELAADLGRWLDGRPIAARPSAFWERAWKSARRRPWQAAMVLLACTFVASVLGVWAWSYARIGDALEVARRDRLRAESASVRSDRLAVEAKRLAVESKRLAASEASARAESTRRSASLALDKGVLLAESGRVGRGLLWMARAHESAAGLDEPLRRVARASLADWGRRATRPRAVVDLGSPVHNFDFHADLRLAAVGGLRRPLLLDLATLGPARSFPDDMDWNLKAVLSRDGRRLAAAEGTRSRAWDLPSGTLVGEFPGKDLGVHPDRVAIDPTGHRVALIDYIDHKLWVWDLDGERPGARVVQPEAGYWSAEFSPDGRLVAAVGEDRVTRVWDAKSLELVRAFPATAGPSGAIFLPDGSGLVLWGDGASPRVAVWDLHAPGPRFERRLVAAVAGLAIRPDGRAILIGGLDGSIRLLDATSGDSLGPVIQAEAPVSIQGGSPWRGAVTLSPDGQAILSAHADSTARAWDVATGRPVGSVMEHPGGLAGVGFAPDGRAALTATTGGRVALWDLAEGPTGRPMAHRSGLGLARGEVSPDDSLVVATGQVWHPFAALIDVATGLPRSGPLLHGGEPVDVARFSPDGSLVATGGHDRMVRLWDTARGRPVGRPLACGHWATNFAFSPDGRTLVALNAGNRLQGWEVATGKPLGPPSPAEGQLLEKFLLFSPDGRTLLTKTLDELVLRWEVPTLRRVGEPLRPADLADKDGTGASMVVAGLQPVAFSPDGATLWLLEAGHPPGSGVVRRRDPATWRAIGEPIGRDVEAAILAPDARRLLTKAGTTVRQYDAATGILVGSAMEHPSPVLAMAFQPDGSTIATGSEDGGLRFWDAATGRPIGPTRWHSGAVGDLKFVGKGDRVVTFVGEPIAWDVPRPVADDPARIAGGVRAASLMELEGDGDGTRRLPLDAWRRLRDEPGGSGDVEPLPAAEWHERLAARFALHGPPSAALWHLDRLLAGRPDDAPALLRRAGVRAGMGDPAGAEADESRAAALDPGLVEAWRAWRTFDAESAGRLDEALDDLDLMLAARPDDANYRARRADLRLRLGRRSEALADLREVVRSSPGPTEDFYRYALLALDLGDLAGYREGCERGLSLLPARPTVAEANSAAWQLALGEGAPDLDRAIKLAEAAVSRLPDDRKWLAINTLGGVLYRAGRDREAADRLADSVRLGRRGGVPQDWAFLALAHHRLGDQATARSWLARLQAWTPVGTKPSFWEDLEIGLLRREAVAVILLDPAFPADAFRRD